MQILNKLKQWSNSYIHEPIDVYDAHKFLFFMSQICGLVSYKLHRNNGTAEYKNNYVLAVVNILIILLFLSAFILLAVNFKEAVDQVSGYYEIEIYVNCFQYLLSTIEVIASTILSKKIIRIFKNIVEIDKNFHEINIWISYKKTHIYCFLGVLGNFLQCVFMIGFAKIPMPNLDWYHKVFIYIVFIAPVFVNGFVQCQYVIYTTMLKNRYKILNEYLTTMIENKTRIEVWTVNNKVDSVKAPVSLKPLKLISDPNYLLEKIMGLHIKLSQTAKLINKGYRVQLLLLILVCFLAIVCAFYLMGVNFISTTTNQKKLENNVTFLIWVTTNTIALISIVYTTSSLCEEANETARILHKIWNHTSNIKLQDAIEMYSLQMHQNRLKFTVCGLFPLDNSLIYSITASVSTYLIIMIQFSNFNDTNRSKNATDNGTIAT